VRRFFATLQNLQLVGRNGMHKYNNQDHSMMTGLLAAENILGANYDLWEMNVDQEYQEEFRGGSSESLGRSLADLASSQPAVPERVLIHAVEAAVEYET
jgi:hypothetical protein